MENPEEPGCSPRQHGNSINALFFIGIIRTDDDSGDYQVAESSAQAHKKVDPYMQAVFNLASRQNQQLIQHANLLIGL